MPFNSTSAPENVGADLDLISRIPAVPAILEIICRITGMGFAAVARVTDCKWVACSVYDEINFGLRPGGELQLETTICHEIRRSGQEVAIDHVEEDPYFSGHPTPALYGFQSYISVPIIKRDGSFFGTLCAIDPRPAKVNNPEIISMFKLHAELIAFHLNALEDLAATEDKLMEEQKTAEVREQFIAILGHDLRNPVGAVKNVAQLLQRGNLDEQRVQRLAAVLQNSSYRMLGLIDNIMDFARGRLGEGIVLNMASELLDKTLNHVIDELRLVWPESKIEAQFELLSPVVCDSKRIAQLFSNLLANALTHGVPNAPIYIKALNNEGELLLSVTNSGPAIPKSAMQQLFKPFSRSVMKKGQEGLGLGLFISSEIAHAHGGSIDVNSTGESTSFTLNIPQGASQEG